MYLSRIQLDHRNRNTLRALSNPNIFHGAVERCFPGERERRLWRIDWLNGGCCLLIVSGGRPDFHGLADQFGALSPGESKAYDGLLKGLQAGQSWQFRLCANPVRSAASEEGKRGKVYAHVTTEQQKKWLSERAERHGFLLEEAGFDVVESQWFRFRRGGGQAPEVVLRTAAFEGRLQVASPEKLRDALLSGIGREKAYGCGMLTLARPRVG